jgi:MOSC domain-containing protein YiiM
MRNVPAPSSDASPLTRSVVACIASILEVNVDEVPGPPPGDAVPWTVWSDWLATRGLGLVPIADPAGFNWPGPWIALVPAGARGRAVHAKRPDPEIACVAFGAPPGLVWDPLGAGARFEDVVAGYVIAPADPRQVPVRPVATERTSGRVELIAIARDAAGPMTVVSEATARAGRGLEGDRYFARTGTFSDNPGTGRHLTLVEAEAIEALNLPDGPLALQDARRNVVTRGIDLNALVGRRFRVGEVECAGRRLCEPCAHLQRLTQPGALRALVHRGGLRADVLSDGVIRTGDVVVGPASPSAGA